MPRVLPSNKRSGKAILVHILFITNNFYSKTYQFLTHLPISGSIASAVLKDDACATDIFPLKHPFKVRYACTALQSKLQTYLNKVVFFPGQSAVNCADFLQGVADGHFIGHTIKHLVSVLCDDTLMHCSFDRNDDFDLVSMLVNTIVVFLKGKFGSAKTCATMF